jgi:hypothetical protein
MIYEGTIQFVEIDKNGNDKTTKHNFILDNIELFGEAEEMLYKYGQSLTDCEVIAIKRSKVKEIANSRGSEQDKVWLAEVEDVFLGDEGEEKSIKYKILLYAKNFDSAMKVMDQFLAQGYSMTLVTIKRTNIVDILTASK